MRWRTLPADGRISRPHHGNARTSLLISAMLILAVGGQEIAAETRVLPLGLSRRNDLPRTRGTHRSMNLACICSVTSPMMMADDAFGSTPIREHVQQRATVDAERQRNH